MHETKEQYEAGSRWIELSNGEEYILCVPHVVFSEDAPICPRSYWVAINIRTGCRWIDMTLIQSNAVRGLHHYD